MRSSWPNHVSFTFNCFLFFAAASLFFKLFSRSVSFPLSNRKKCTRLTVYIVDLEEELDLVFRSLPGKLVHGVQEFLDMIIVNIFIIFVIILILIDIKTRTGAYYSASSALSSQDIKLPPLTPSLSGISIHDNNHPEHRPVDVMEPGRRWSHCHPCQRSGTLAQQRKAGGRSKLLTFFFPIKNGQHGQIDMFTFPVDLFHIITHASFN